MTADLTENLKHSGQKEDGDPSASPLARRIAERMEIDLSEIEGSGNYGLISQADVRKYLGHCASPSNIPVEADDHSTTSGTIPSGQTSGPSGCIHEPVDELKPLTHVRRIAAQRLSRAKREIPHFYLSVDCEVDALLKFRDEHGNSTNHGFSLNDLILKAAALALRKYPAANASWSEKGIRIHHAVNLAVAVATSRGLFTPVIRDADRKGIHAIAREMNDMTARARSGKLNAEELKDGTFTVSNLGMYGIHQAVAVINPPQACVLAVGTAEQKPVSRSGRVVNANMMNCTLSSDHRVLDGSEAAQFLASLKRFLEEPLHMLV